MSEEPTRSASADAPIVIYATRGFDNYTFALDIESREQILAVRERQIVPATRVTVAFDIKDAFEQSFGAIEPHIVTLLTGLSLERLRSRWRLEVRDSKTDQLLWTGSAQVE
ncbi:MAG: hypothetical protein R3A52_07165 [Polyangiales bacterium]